MHKVLIIGCPGSGKSTFARKLHEMTQIPLYHLDNMYWNADKTTVSSEEFRSRLDNALQQPSWIIDGNYASTMEYRIQYCDTIFFLDYPTEVCIAGVKARKGKERSDIPWIEESDDEEFLQFITKFQEVNRPKIIELLQKCGKEVYVFTTREEANQYVLKNSPLRTIF